MKEEILRTSADDLYELVKSRKKISIEDAAKMLGMPLKSVNAVVDFLVEEKIFGIEYKFTTPYIYLNKEKQSERLAALSTGSKIKSKKEFFQKAQKWNISQQTVSQLWNKYVNENLDSIKAEFHRKAKLRNLPHQKIEELWVKYQRNLR